MNTEENLKALVGVLQQTISPDTQARKAGTEFILYANIFFSPPIQTLAEEYLNSIQGHPGYSVLLLRLLSVNGIDPTVQQSSGILFKNFVKRFWTVKDLCMQQKK